jgi:hypothetical protein
MGVPNLSAISLVDRSTNSISRSSDSSRLGEQPISNEGVIARRIFLDRLTLGVMTVRI